MNHAEDGLVLSLNGFSLRWRFSGEIIRARVLIQGTYFINKGAFTPQRLPRLYSHFDTSIGHTFLFFVVRL